MMPTSLQRMVLALLGLLVLLALAGCRKVPTLFRESTPTPTPRTTTPSPPVNRSEQALEAVTAYVTALGEHNYAGAYDRLSKESQ